MNRKLIIIASIQLTFQVEYLYNVRHRLLEVKAIFICYYSTQMPALISIAQNRADLTN